MEAKHDGHRKRLRGKIERYGLESLYPHEMLEYILFGAIPRKNTNALSHRLIATFGSYEGVFLQDFETLMSVEGVGKATALLLLSYAYHAKAVSDGIQDSFIRNHGEAKDMFLNHFLKIRHEEFHVVFLAEDGKITCHEIFTDKEASSVVVPTQTVLEMVVEGNPEFILFCHNHPSGNAMPSAQDVNFTTNMSRNIETVFGKKDWEHLIFGGGDCFSFRNNGFI